jgi:hypothetical protein
MTAETSQALQSQDIENAVFRELKKLGSLSLVGYAFLLLPTLLWLVHCAFDSQLSQQQLWINLTQAWRALFWHLPGLTAKASRLVLDIFRNATIGFQGYLFYRAYMCLRDLKPLSPENTMRLYRYFWLYFCIAGGLLLFIIPFHSSDLYGYLNRGFQQTLLHTNPYTTPIAHIPHWQQYPYLQNHWIYNPSPYGFAFVEAMRQLTASIGPNVALCALAFKAFNLVLLATTLGCIGILTPTSNSERPWLSLILIGANPLVLLHCIANGHNDIWMLSLLMLSLCCLKRSDRHWFVLPLCLLSVLVKYISAIALPFLLIELWRQKAYKALFLGFTVSFFILLMLALPYISPVEGTFLWRDMFDNAGKPEHSILASLAFLGAFLGLSGGIVSWLKLCFLGLFAGFYGWQIIRFARSKDRVEALDTVNSNGISLTGLIQALSLSMMGLILFASAKFHPWYIVMFLPLTVLLPEQSKWRRLALSIAFFQLLAFTALQNIPILNTLVLLLIPLYCVWKGKDCFGKVSSH